jgi:stress response protein YsnF
MNEQAKTQRRQFLIQTKNKLKIKLDRARTLNIETTNEIETFMAAIAAIDLAIEAYDASL